MAIKNSLVIQKLSKTMIPIKSIRTDLSKLDLRKEKFKEVPISKKAIDLVLKISKTLKSIIILLLISASVKSQKNVTHLYSRQFNPEPIEDTSYNAVGDTFILHHYQKDLKPIPDSTWYTKRTTKYTTYFLRHVKGSNKVDTISKYKR